MSTKYNLTPSFWKMFPETKSAEDKALKFLQLYFDCGRSFNKVAKELGYDPHTVSRIMDDIQQLPIHSEFIQKVNASVDGFADANYTNTLFARYEAELQDTEEEINTIKWKLKKSENPKNDDDKLSVNQQTSLTSAYLRLKTHKKTLLDKMLDTAMDFKKTGMNKKPPKGDGVSEDDIIGQAADQAFTGKVQLQ